MPTISHAGNAPKSMSTRLLTMKFMQRAAASPPNPTSIPTEESSPKRRKKELDVSASPKQNTEALADRNAVLKALAVEEEKNLAVLDKLAAESGDTRWVLDYKEHENSPSVSSLRVIQIGYASLDDGLSTRSIKADEPDDGSIMFGRKSFGRFNKILEKQQNPHTYQDSESDSEQDDKENDDSSGLEDSDSENYDPTSELIKTARREMANKTRAELKSKRRDPKAESEQPTKKRRKEEVNLNNLTSLSGRQDVAPRMNIECFSCGGPHRKIDCPSKKRRHQFTDDLVSRKTSKPS